MPTRLPALSTIGTRLIWCSSNNDRDFMQWRFRGGRNNVGGHNIFNLGRMGFDVIGRDRRIAREEMYPPRVGVFGPGLCATHQIAFSYDADKLASIVNHGNRTYALLKQDFCDFTNGRGLAYGNYRRNHHITRLHDQHSLMVCNSYEALRASSFDPRQDIDSDEGCRVQSRVMIARIHRKISHPAATSNMLTIKRRAIPRYGPTLPAFPWIGSRLPCRSR